MSGLRVMAGMLGMSLGIAAHGQAGGAAKTAYVLKAARMLDVRAGRVVSPGEVVVQDGRIASVGAGGEPAGAEVIDLGDVTLMPGMIDAHVHLFLHPGAEDSQTIDESVPKRTLIAMDAAKLDLMAGFTAERDMGTEGAGPADTAVRNAINSGLFPGPRMRMSGNAISITGGHEDAIGYNPAQHVLGNADYADSADEIVKVIREQRKQGADFTKMYETGKDRESEDGFTTPYQYTEAELKAAVDEAARLGLGPGHGVAVHATGEPGTGYAVAAGVMSIDHGYQLSAATMRMMKEKGIPAVPTFAISEYFAEHASLSVGRGAGAEAADLACGGVQEAAGGRGADGGGQRCGSVSAWDAGQGDGVDGGVWDAGGGGAEGGSVEWGKAAGVGGKDRGVEGGVLCGCDRGRRRSGEGYLGDDEGQLCDEGWCGVSQGLEVALVLLDVVAAVLVEDDVGEGVAVVDLDGEVAEDVEAEQA